MTTAVSEKKNPLDSVREKLKGVNLRQNGIFLALIGLVIFFALTTPNAASNSAVPGRRATMMHLPHRTA
jgi:hypothetical protein